MLLNFKIEICRKGISAAEIAHFLGIRTETMSKKVTEKVQFTRTEMYKIHDEFFSDTDFHYLFRSDKNSRKE